MFGIKVFFLNLSKHIWPKVTLFALFAAFSALAAIFMGEYIPDDIAYKIDGETIGSILTILASSMLAVTTFSLTLMVQAYSSATTTVTPRATQLVIQDHTAQNVLSTFLGTFLFSLIGIIALNTGVYRANGRLILFATTLVIVVVILVSMIRWIERLTKIGRVAETTRQVEEAARESLGKRAASPWFGCNKLDEEKLSGLEGIFGDIYGYVQYVDFEKISEVADRNECEIHVAATPGKFVYPNQAYLHANVRLSEEDVQALLSAFKIADERTFEQDPRFGICVLAEIAERALSPDRKSVV